MTESESGPESEPLAVSNPSRLAAAARRLRRRLPGFPAPSGLPGALFWALLGIVAGVFFGLALGGPRGGPEENPHEAAPAAAGAHDPAVWTCSMHPQIRQPEPGLCPLCGMDLIPAATGDAAASDPGGQVSRVVLSERAQALAKLRTTAVRRRSDAASELRLLGRVEAAESRERTVTAWFGGRIDRLHVKVTGQRVRAGQTLATLYSPEVFAAHQDLLVAKRQAARLGAGAPPGSTAAVVAGTAALEASRDRLRLLGVPDDALARLENEDRPTRAVAIRSPFTGTVLERLASEGAYVTTGAPLYRLADLSTLWVQLDAYESDLPRLARDQEVRLRIDALPGEEFTGTVTFIDPTIDPRRRTARVRVAVSNRDGRLRPGMFAEATVVTTAAADARAPLVIPASAPLFTGRRALVYVEIETAAGTAYEPRTVRLGPRQGDGLAGEAVYPVVAGLSEGERVVSRGAFAVDADLQIRGGPSMMSAADDREEGLWDAAIALSDGERAPLRPVVAAYLEVQVALAADDLEAAKEAAGRLAVAIRAVDLEAPAEAVSRWAELSPVLEAHARQLDLAADIEGARAGFEGLSAAISALLRYFGNPLDRPLHLAFCPMALGSQGASWIQASETLDNSYFGATMRTCGELRGALEPGAYLPPAAGGGQ